MNGRSITPEDLVRLKGERDAAESRYNDALTALDTVRLRELPDLPHPPPGPDEFQVSPLNERWLLLPETPAFPPPTGWREQLAIRLWGLVAPSVWRLLAPYLERQQAFNSAVVDHVNRNIPVARATRQSIESTLALLGEQIRLLAGFELHLLAYLQHVTAAMDVRDREHAGLARRVHEDNRELIELLSHRTVGLAGAISGVGEELLKRWEAMVARERRFDARVSTLSAAHDDVRVSLATLMQTASTVKRELDRLQERVAAGNLPASSGTFATGPATAAPTSASSFEQASASSIDAYKYVGFEDRFRGSRDEIRARQEAYVEMFAGRANVVDIGCGRGEFLDLLRERGIGARGVDLNREMVEQCRARGLQADEGDAVGFLRAQPDGSLGGLVALQVVEHLQPDYLLQFLDAAYHALAPGSPLVLETINPTCWAAFFESYIRDVTHARPIHPDTLSYYASASGFQKVTVHYSAPCPEEWKLRRVDADSPAAQALNHNVDLLNARLFTYQDFALIAEKL